MKVTEGKLVTLIQEESGDQDKHLIYIEDHPNLKLIDIETMLKSTWYWYVDETIAIDGKVGLRLDEKAIILFDPIYARMRLRLPDEPTTRSYLEYAQEAIEKFKNDDVQYLYLPKVSDGDILIIRECWIGGERAEVVDILRELCKDYGDNDWEDNLNLRDVIEKHLAKHLWKT